MKELLEKRAKVFEQARGLILRAEKEGRALTSEEQTEYDARMTDVRALGETIERSRQSAEFNDQLDRSIGPLGGNNGGQRRNPGSDLADGAMDTFLRSGRDQLNSEQRSIFAPVQGYKDSIQFRAASPLSDVTGAAGAYTVPQGFVYQLEKAMKWFGGMRQSRAKIIRTATGNPLPWPTMNDTGNVGELVAENTAATQAATEMAFGQILFNGWKYSSKVVLVPIELIQDSAFDVQSFVAEALGIRLGRIQNTHFTTGDGNSKPNGLITAATSALTSGSATAVTYDELVSLTHKVDPAYRIGAEWMFNDGTAGYWEKMRDNNGRPLLNTSLTGLSGEVKAGDPNAPARFTILGYPVVINNDMDDIAATKKAVAFGDMSKYIIRDVLDLMLVRFGELYMASGQIGFLCFSRTDGDLADAGMHPVQFITQHA